MPFHYENAPITEALIDIRVEFSISSVTLEDLDAIHEAVKDSYPGKQKRVYVEGQFLGGNEVGATAKQTLMGFGFTSANGKQLFQVRLDGFTFSRLKPYGTWGELRDEAKRLWKLYERATKPLKSQQSRCSIHQSDRHPFRGNSRLQGLLPHNSRGLP